jgi:hypothetical protein
MVRDDVGGASSSTTSPQSGGGFGKLRYFGVVAILLGQSL